VTALAAAVRLDGDDPQELWRLLTELRLTDLDPRLCEQVEHREGGKGAGAVLRWLAVQDLTAEGLRAMLTAVAQWVVRTRRTVRITIGEDELVLANATSEQQDRLIEAFIARQQR
jgi:hypothetical protein